MTSISMHPCFNGGCGNYARIHLPVAPQCNIHCNYCVRKFDCVNESRPGVASKVLSPEEALARYLTVKQKVKNLTIAGIAGPGDPLANWPVVKETIQKIKAADREAQFCLSTNGLLLPERVDELKETGVNFLTVTVNALEPRIGRKIYRYVHWQGKKVGGEAGFEILSQNQQTGIHMAVKRGIVCKVNTVVISGINDTCTGKIAAKAASLGCYLFNAISLIPVKGSTFEKIPLIDEVKIQSIRKQCGAFIRQMYHCQRCRADAIGCLNHDVSGDFK